MAENKSVLIYRMKTPDNVKKCIENIVDQLERYGRAINVDGNISRTFSRYLRNEIRMKKIYFSGGIIAIPHNVKLYRTKQNKIKLEFDEGFRL